MNFGEIIRMELNRIYRNGSWLGDQIGKSHAILGTWERGGDPKLSTAIDVIDVLSRETNRSPEKIFGMIRTQLQDEVPYWEEALRPEKSLYHLISSIFLDGQFRLHHIRDGLYSVRKDELKLLCHFVDGVWYYTRPLYNSFFETWYESKRQELTYENIKNEKNEL